MSQPSLTAFWRHRRFVPALCTFVVALIWLGWLLWQPSPNKTIVMSVGNDGGIYQAFALKYADILARKGIHLELRKSSGSVENYQRLKDPASDIDLALMQSGIGDARNAPNLEALAAVSYEPIWLFYNGTTRIDQIARLTGKRLAIGRAGSGLRRITIELLAAYGINASNTTLIEMTSRQAEAQLLAGDIDAGFFVGIPETPLIASLLRTDLKLMSFSQADAIVRKFPSLSKVVFPRGAIDLQRDLPAQDVTLLSATAMLVAKNRLHPLLIYALLDSAVEVHAEPGFFSVRNEFPNQHADDFPMSEEARRYFRSGRPFLQNYLPFWLANFIEQRFVIVVPLLAMLFALLQTVPRILAYRVRTRLSHWYRDLNALENAMRTTPDTTPTQRDQWQEQLAQLDADVHQLVLSPRYFNQLYALKLSIQIVRNLLHEHNDEAVRT
ncbi:TAXI family TRAP transporter solute-binding subunit [Actimicrobium sp. CCC2.4]|uniref:TAXI family TRAP transporter solute-binding subunit n=1 Tax=Actimicrobium sp. CCC2.4 TaxID=3048606 RepID=UPI002AC927FA|nr:TAXI family TRAP transporter solute-binding subunit [Actimicrobium sp. CCC2.4]MEB0134792.1 TAXI family TRAP transporter solute-binding subunit [Actimicrobium sp. CCC2.4]WPX30730.1 TAXI family TRAP transporter solute-binding subunit [Actimicrobium sp. CCC2.4]